ncbi:transposase [Amphibacillus cookii]|uniref:transposase n=1 Tax=Amphibacillus cookii TaxID=767787 RepID=UPI001EF762EB|nr:transposase [Amphibacillus cookii]
MGNQGKFPDILPHRVDRTIKGHFITYYTLEQRTKVKTVTIDMVAAYVNIIKKRFPNADIIIDRFHIVQ